MTSLPSPRALLTSLLDSISSPSQPDPATTPHTHTQTHHHPRDPPLLPNPLRDAPAEKTALLSTLHVLFPSLLLPALDLLDRGLVAREAEETGVEEDKSRHYTDLYIVKSLASTMRGKGAAGGGARYYLVLLGAWSCTCPSFAFDAFPPLASASLVSGHGMATAGTAGGEGRDEQHGGGGGDGKEWSFGGMSRDGTGTGAGTPCCKHLLACVLAERWGGVLGVYAPLKTIGRGEMAGLVADV
ncbi:uncharacterized protein DNG_08010 [Cephalotrichum gorgonifer]|uniref:SWIM-type domain-containing protein n=1 Tax=Cephalotrichum gorgonifer TaxID=2041049 RepID=A0AAE8SY37_9PEZI|nr:uncharacterized protein DNG_08010 [Cephalotrichum gorgonifer]